MASSTNSGIAKIESSPPIKNAITGWLFEGLSLSKSTVQWTAFRNESIISESVSTLTCLIISCFLIATIIMRSESVCLVLRIFCNISLYISIALSFIFLLRISREISRRWLSTIDWNAHISPSLYHSSFMVCDTIWLISCCFALSTDFSIFDFINNKHSHRSTNFFLCQKKNKLYKNSLDKLLFL